VPDIDIELFPKIDVYSYGLILWEICSHERVFLEFGDDEFERFCKSICDRNVRPSINSSIPEVLIPIIKACWSKDPTERPDFLEIVPALDDARIKFYLTEPSEIAFWKTYFPNKFKVPFIEFKDKLWRHYFKIMDRTTVDTVPNECDFFTPLNEIIGSEADIPFSQVTLLAYEKLIAWFGPLFTRKNFRDFCDIMKKPWFFNTILGGTTAEQALQPNPNGFFIVRRTPDILQDDRIGYPFTIDYYFKDEIVHHRVLRLPNGFYQLNFNNKIYEKESFIILMDSIIGDEPKVFKSPVKLKNKVV